MHFLQRKRMKDNKMRYLPGNSIIEANPFAFLLLNPRRYAKQVRKLEETLSLQPSGRFFLIALTAATSAESLAY